MLGSIGSCHDGTVSHDHENPETRTMLATINYVNYTASYVQKYSTKVALLQVLVHSSQHIAGP